MSHRSGSAMFSRRLAALGLALAVGGSACVPALDDEDGRVSAPSPAATAPAATEPDTVGTEAPTAAAAGVPEILDFRAETVDGSTFDGVALAGDAVLLWFWAPW